MVNEHFDLEYWKTVFPIDRLHEIFPDYSYLINDIGDVDVTSPFHLVVNESLREQNPVSQQQEPNPVNIFVWAYGESSQRQVKKIGGLPYFPASRPWPQSAEGEPLEFMAQICFKDSFDICGELPGDVLVVFAKPDYAIFCGSVFADDPLFHFEGVSIGDFPLVLPTDLPPSRLNLFPCYGAIYRTIEPIAGTKIGGVSSWIQEAVSVPGRFLFQLHSIAPESLLPYPFINVPAPPVLPKIEQVQFVESWSVLGIPLRWGDLGQVYFFLDGDEFQWVAQCT